MNTLTPRAVGPAAIQRRALPPTEAARDLAYRRLTAAILRLDVATLARELEAARLYDTPFKAAA